LNGNFVVLLFDRGARKFFIVTDRWGLVPAFSFQDGSNSRVYGSHPDILADVVGQSRNWDLTSFAEFILTGKLSAPFTYYTRIQALPVGSTISLSMGGNGELSEARSQYFRFDFNPEPEKNEEELAEQFAAAFKQAVAMRTLPVLGKSAVGLSGGLDSRAVISAAPDRGNLISFSCYNEENREFQIAKSIAGQTRVPFIPLRRDFDYYGNQAAMGARISAGMGCLASNHFLGFREQLRNLQVENLLTGCYCDYLFKGLALNRRVNRWTTREALGRFDFSYYFSHFSANTQLGERVRQRLETIFPTALRRYDSESAVFEVEQRRMFPLCYEEDNAERTIPQRVMGWYVPIADNQVMDIILKLPYQLKLNRKLFARMVGIVCDPTVSRIPDANTGAPVSASVGREALQSHLSRVMSLCHKLKRSNATNGSWLNWNFYVLQSQVIKSLWSAPNPDAQGLFEQVLGKNEFKSDIGAYQGKRVYLFLQLLTLKVWLDQRSQ
jgi:asparagine synthase (glutamine-hydrolysing)